ncbi:MAG: hypothetical protein QOJ35_342 [Solirubrobacteraceae bacterium]|jgi:hypothetical protein|nr:hypothetical protein [Solirubrobacteraceae bacterium]
MLSLSFAVSTILSMALGVVIGVAFFGPPPRRRAAPAMTAVLAGLGLAAWFGGLVAMVLQTAGSTMFLALGVIGLSAARWFARAPMRDDDGPSDPPPDDGPPPLDWDLFEHARRDWSRERDRVG